MNKVTLTKIQPVIAKLYLVIQLHIEFREKMGVVCNAFIFNLVLVF